MLLARRPHAGWLEGVHSNKLVSVINSRTLLAATRPLPPQEKHSCENNRTTHTTNHTNNRRLRLLAHARLGLGRRIYRFSCSGWDQGLLRPRGRHILALWVARYDNGGVFLGAEEGGWLGFCA